MQLKKKKTTVFLQVYPADILFLMDSDGNTSSLAVCFAVVTVFESTRAHAHIDTRPKTK